MTATGSPPGSEEVGVEKGIAFDRLESELTELIPLLQLTCDIGRYLEKSAWCDSF